MSPEGEGENHPQLRTIDFEVNTYFFYFEFKYSWHAILVILVSSVRYRDLTLLYLIM